MALAVSSGFLKATRKKYRFSGRNKHNGKKTLQQTFGTWKKRFKKACLIRHLQKICLDIQYTLSNAQGAPDAVRVHYPAPVFGFSKHNGGWFLLFLNLEASEISTKT